MEWTDERIARLRELHANKELSFSEMADDIGGVTRNACIGKARRLGLMRRDGVGRLAKRNKPPRPKHAPAAAVRRTTRISRTLSPNHFAIIEMDEEPVRELPASEIPIKQRKVVATIGFDDCRWPYGDPHKADFFFCGAERSSDLPYCKTHAGIAYKTAPRTLSEQEHARRMAVARRRANEGQRWGSESA